MMTKITSKVDHSQLVVATEIEPIGKTVSAVATLEAALRATRKSGSDLGIDSLAERCLAVDPS